MNDMEDAAMVAEGARVRLRPDSSVLAGHPELRDMVGVVGAIMKGKAWSALGSSAEERTRDTTVHVRFRDLNVVALSVPAGDVEPVDRLSPELRAL